MWCFIYYLLNLIVLVKSSTAVFSLRQGKWFFGGCVSEGHGWDGVLWGQLLVNWYSHLTGRHTPPPPPFTLLSESLVFDWLVGQLVICSYLLVGWFSVLMKFLLPKKKPNRLLLDVNRLSTGLTPKESVDIYRGPLSSIIINHSPNNTPTLILWRCWMAPKTP
jgi:hypothetical protein